MQDNRNNDLMKVRQARAKYAREWRKRNPGKQAEYSFNYWRRKAEELNNQTNTTEKKED